ncbi:MAG: hypothetical protein ACR2J9_01910, partial [Gaiellales bacterium]
MPSVTDVMRQIGVIVGGPWPFHPFAVLLIVIYSMLLRSAVRVMSQPAGAAPWTIMVPRVAFVGGVTA